MNPDNFKLLGMLPGLYYARDQINAQIETIEQLFNQTPKLPSRKMKTKPDYSSQMKKVWKSMTPEQKAERKKKMIAGLRKFHANRKKTAAN